jgi:WD40 repeat protein
VLNLPTASSNSVTFSPDGKWLVTADAGQYSFWEVRSWKLSHRIPRNTGGLNGWIAFAPDGRLAALADTLRLVKLVEPGSGREVASLPAPIPDLITRPCFSPDGSQLAVASENNLIHLWDLRLIRGQLSPMGLDWDLPPYPAPNPKGAAQEDRKPMQVVVDLGDVLKGRAMAPAQPQKKSE